MRFFKILFFSLFIFTISIHSQSVSGIITDSIGVRLAGVEVKLYSMAKYYVTNTSYNGTFSIDFPTGVDATTLPEGYNVSNNYPNPFNPKTRINITLPKASSIKTELYNIAGQKVKEAYENNFNAGTNYLDFELNGLPNGFYFAKITIDGKLSIIKKMILLYGSQHLNTLGKVPNEINNKTAKDIFIDSIIISSGFTKKTVIKPQAYTTGVKLDLGKIIIEKIPEQYTPCPEVPRVNYAGRAYNTIKIGNQCWLKENLSVGIMIDGATNQTDNHIIEKHCYDNIPENCIAYGGYYQWSEAMQYSTEEKTKGICPFGWHIPSYREYDSLLQFVNYNGNSLKVIGQGTDWGAGTNSSGFSILMAGCSKPYGYASNILFANLGYHTYLWTSKSPVALIMIYNSNSAGLYNDAPSQGYSVRCIKDN